MPAKGWKEEMGRYYIAYGSNMDLRQMALRCPGAKLVGKSRIGGYALAFRGSLTGAYATIEPREGGTVPVLVWRIAKTDEERLDIYEGFPRFYCKQELTVRAGGKERRAMAYVMDPRRKPGVPSKEYLGCLERAYDSFGFDRAALAGAVEESRIRMMRMAHPHVQDFQLPGWTGNQQEDPE